MRADLLVSAASSGRNTLSRNHSSEGTVTTTRARNFSEGMIKRFPNTQRVIRRQPRVDGHDASSPTQLMKPYNLISLDEGDDRRQIESMLTLRAHNKKKYLSRSMDGLLKVSGALSPLSLLSGQGEIRVCLIIAFFHLLTAGCFTLYEFGLGLSIYIHKEFVIFCTLCRVVIVKATHIVSAKGFSWTCYHL